VKILLILSSILFGGCATQKICINQVENARSIYDVDNSCHMRIRQVVIGSDAEIPKSIDFKSGQEWSYSWVETKFENGKLTLGHFVMAPVNTLMAKDANGK